MLERLRGQLVTGTTDHLRPVTESRLEKHKLTHGMDPVTATAPLHWHNVGSGQRPGTIASHTYMNCTQGQQTFIFWLSFDLYINSEVH